MGIKGLQIPALIGIVAQQFLALFLSDRAHAGLRRTHKYALPRARYALVLQRGYQRFTYTEFADRGERIQRRIVTKRLRCCPNRLLLSRCLGAKRMLHAIARLCQYAVRDVSGRLGVAKIEQSRVQLRSHF